jgi:hypothetical protein
VRPLRPSGRFPLIVASLASVAALAWLAWRWSDPLAGAAHRPAAADANAVQIVTPPPPDAASAPTGPRERATPRPQDPGKVKGPAADPARSGDRLVRAASAPPDDRPRPGAGGSIVAIDPETGQLGAPSPEQMRALEQAGRDLAVSRTGEGLRETVLPNGTVIVDLDGRFEEHVVARVDRTGRLVQGCIHDVRAVAKALRDTTAGRGLEVE